VDSVLHRRSVLFPTCASNPEMAQNFSEFLRDKIVKIRTGLESVSHDNPQYAVTDTDKITDVVFDRFQPVTEEQNRHGLDEKMQSAYKSGHITEAALLRLKNDLLMAIDGWKAVVLVLLDLSAAFDTIDHEIICSRLERLLGLSGKPSAWLSSYLAARSQCVAVEGVLSEVLCLLFGVPQGSVMAPILFIIYTIPLSIIA